MTHDEEMQAHFDAKQCSDVASALLELAALGQVQQEHQAEYPRSV